MCCQPGNHSACQLRKPIDVVATKSKMQLRWNHARPAEGPEGRKPKRNGSRNEQGLEVKDALSPSGRGRKMSLTSPFIDQALVQACAVCSPKFGSGECNGDITTAIANRCAPDAIFSTTSERSRWALHSGKKRDSVFGRHVSLSVLSDHSFADPSLDRVLVPVAERARFA